MFFSPFSRLIVLLFVQSSRVSASLFRSLAITCRSSESLPSLGSNTLALGSCLCDNKSKTRQRQAVVLSSHAPRKPCDLCVLRVSASLLRTFSHLARAAAPCPTLRTFEACYRTQSDWKSLLHTLPATTTCSS